MARADAEIALQGVKANGTWTAGAVTAITVTAGGSGYSAATIAFSGGGGSGTTATVTVSGNAVTAVTITAAGTGYTSVPTATISGDGTGATATCTIAGHVLYVPLSSADSFRAGFVEPVAGKVLNDASADDSTNLTTMPLVTDLTGGAFTRQYDPGNRRFYLPTPSGTSGTYVTGPLAWTAAPIRSSSPLMCGAGWTAQNGNFVFSDITDFKGTIYALDIKNWRVWRESSNVWQYYCGYGSSGWRPYTGTITGAVSNGGPNLVRITSTAHGLVTNQFVDVASVGGVSAATGRWKITVINANSFDLVASTFSGTYTSGGTWFLTGGAGVITSVVSHGGLVQVVSASHGLITGQSVTVYGVNGATGANVTALVTKIDANTFDLQGSTFGGAYTSGGQWAETGLDGAGLTAPPTELFAKGDTNTQILIVGQGTDSDSTTYAKKTSDVQTWTNWQFDGSTNTNAQHFAQVGKRIWYSSGNTLYEAVATNPRTRAVGEKNRDIRRLLWYGNKILVSKDSGLFEYDPRDRISVLIYDAPNKATHNGKTLVLHNGSAWCTFDDNWIEYDLSSVQEHKIWVQDGEGVNPFYNPDVIGAMSSGKRLYMVIRITTSAATPKYHYFLTIYTGAAGGYHPVFLGTTTTAPSSYYEGVGVYWYADQLHYSLGQDSSSQAITGKIFTDGEFPFGDNVNSAYTPNVAIDMGEITMSRDTLSKFFKELRYTIVDEAATAKGKVKFYYILPGDSAWTLIGTSSAGSQSNTTMAFPATAPSLQGLVKVKIRIKVELTNTDANPTGAWYLQNVHLIGAVMHDIAYQAGFSAWLRDDLDEPRPYIKEKILDGLIGAVQQSEPVYLTDLFGKSYYGDLEPVPGGLRLNAYDTNEGHYTDAEFSVSFTETK